MRTTRGLWVSVVFVGILVVSSLAGFFTGTLQPTLGLDLEGGVSVILSAPDGTPRDVMERALENIRNRVDAFGVGEPDIVLSGSTIEVQIPGLSKGTIEQRQKSQFCLVTDEGANHGCAGDRAEADEALKELEVVSEPSEVCLVDGDGKELDCFGSREEADAANEAVQVTPKASPTPSASPSPSPSPATGPAPVAGEFCLTDPTGTEYGCFDSEKDARAAKKALDTEVTETTFCVTDTGGQPPAGGEPGAPDPTPSPSAFSQLDLAGTEALPCGVASRGEAETALAGIAVSEKTVQYCVISSAGEDLGCFIDRTAAEDQQRATGQQRLLDVIGQTARLEQRAVIQIIAQGDPAAASTPLTCGTERERQTAACRFSQLEQQEVVYDDQLGSKFRLGPVVISGGDVKKATAILQGGTSTQVVTEWAVQFELNGEGADRFSDATTRAVTQPPPQDQIAIVVDRKVISAPQVQSAITDGIGVISGGFTEQDSKDLATVLNAGALPVELTRQSVRTVSPTLGDESLRQGIAAGIAGLILLFVYLLFYYRLLGVVAWLGMSIWAILALALVSLAGSQFGYALTLAGVAGLVISLGVTADSYIVFFERLKDEVRSGKSPRSAVQPAFKRAYKTIIAADIVTGIAAVVLYVTAVSSVRGFALTLGVATALDLFVVYFFKRPTVFLIARNDRLVGLPGFGLRSGVAADATDTGPVSPVGEAPS